MSILAEWAIAKDTVPGVTIDDHNVVWLLSIANFIWALGNAMMTAPAFSTAIRNFPSARGTVVGFCKGAVGIIGGLFTQLWAGYMFVPDKGIHTVDYLLAVAVYIFVVAMCALPFIKVYEATPSQSTRKRRIQYSYVNLFLLCVVVGIAAAMESSNSSSARRGFAIGITFLVCTLFGVFVIRSDDTQTITTTDENTNKSVVVPAQNEGKKLGNNLSLLTIIQMRECWCILLCAMALFGCGTMITSNLAQMVTARNMSTVTKSMGVSIFSFTQALSRMVCGVGADVVLLNMRLPTWYAGSNDETCRSLVDNGFGSFHHYGVQFHGVDFLVGSCINGYRIRSLTSSSCGVYIRTLWFEESLQKLLFLRRVGQCSIFTFAWTSACAVLL